LDRYLGCVDRFEAERDDAALEGAALYRGRPGLALVLYM
jgi:hypothetical protein